MLKRNFPWAVLPLVFSLGCTEPSSDDDDETGEATDDQNPA